MPRQWTWYYPTSLDEAAEILREQGERSVLVAGGTALCLSPPSRDGLAMVDLGRAGSAEVVVDGDAVRIGAMTTPTALTRAEALAAVGTGMLREAGRGVGPRPVRNRATVGGNCIRAFPWSDLPAPLLALGASFELRSAGGTSRRVAAEELFAAQPRTVLERGELLASVTVPKDGPGAGGAFIKHAATAVEHALVSVAARVVVDGERCTEASIVAGSLTPLPQRLKGVEETLVGQALSSSTLASAADRAREADVTKDRRAEPEHRRQVATVIVRRALERAVERARGGAS